MGTAGFGPGNATPVAEFNVYKDAPAYKVMLELGVPGFGFAPKCRLLFLFF